MTPNDPYFFFVGCQLVIFHRSSNFQEVALGVRRSGPHTEGFLVEGAGHLRVVNKL